MAIPHMKEIESAKTVSGPYSLFHNSYTLEFLEPPESLQATVLIRGTYLNTAHPQGKSHAQSPPLHLHFDQSESFFVAQGVAGITSGWAVEDRPWTREDSIYEIVPGVPHRFWPHPDAKQDTVLYLWAHPDGVSGPMDRLFFENLLRYMSDASEGRRRVDLVQLMVMQHATASALIMFPTAWWLGPLRWWIPWKVQGLVAWVGRCCGYRALMREYVTNEEWETYTRGKGKLS